MLATTAEVKQFVFNDTTNTEFDTLIGSLIDHVEDMIKKEFGIVTVDSTTYSDIDNEIQDSTGEDKIYTKFRPVQTVDKIEYRNSDWTFTEYTDQTAASMEKDDYKIFTKYVIAGKGKRNLRVSYTCGYKTADVPEDLNLATILLVAHLFNNRETTGLSSHSILGLSVTMTTEDNLFVRKILTKYKRIHAY